MVKYTLLSQQAIKNNCTSSNEEDIIGPLHALNLVHSNLCVAHIALEQERRAADRS